MTQNKLIINHLQQGKTLTSLEALKLFGCFRLSARIAELKNQGFDIISNNIKENGKTFAEYRLGDQHVG